MLVTTTSQINGYEITRYIGIAKGVCVSTPTCKQEMFADFKNLIGGPNGSYQKMCEETQNKAFQRMMEDARTGNADAIIGVSYNNTSIGGKEIGVQTLCYGTAVNIRKV